MKQPILFLILLFCLNLSSQTVSSFHANGWNSIGRFDRLELGISIPQKIDSLIEQFLIGKEGINPYNFKETLVEAKFVHATQEYTRDGFYLREISILPITNTFTPSKSSFPFRIRFAPPENGKYNFTIKLTIDGIIISDYSGSFTVIESGKRGFLSVGNNYHLKDSHDKPFVVIGQALGFCEDPCCPVQPDDFYHHREWIQDLADNSGNFFRLRLDSWDNEVEFEELGVYGSQRTPDENYQRQWQAFEVDSLFAKAEKNNLYIFLTLLGDYHFKSDGSFNFGWQTNPYRKILEKSTNFFDINQSEALDLYKNKLRYLMARYGYSSNLALIGIINETDHIENYENDSKIRSQVNAWTKTIGAFLKDQSFYPHHLLTTGYATTPKAPDEGIDNSMLFDVVTTNNYSSSRRSIKERHDDIPPKTYSTPDSKKPFIYGEIGGGLCHLNTARPEWFSDADFHNNLWATIMFDHSLGNGMYWDDWQQISHLEPVNLSVPGIQHRKNFKALATFFNESPPPYEMETFKSNWDSDLNAAERLENRKIEWIANVSKGGTKGFGWVHNSDYYWINDPFRLTKDNCPNCIFGGMNVFYDSECYQENVSDVSMLNEPKGPFEYSKKHETITLKGYQVLRNYKIEIWSCYGNGGLVTTFHEKSTIFGHIKFKRNLGVYPNDPDYGDPDFAFKVSLANEEFEQFVTIFPNPCTSDFQITSEKDIHAIQIFNSLGILIFEVDNLSTRAESIDMSSEPGGLYIVKLIFTDSQVEQLKLIKM